MAMISLKNLVAPVSNSVHLASIFFVVLVFGVWRWSGGEVNFVRGTRSLTTHNSSTAKEAGAELNRDLLPARQAEASRGQNSGVINVPAEAADDLLGSILAGNDDKGATGRKHPAPQKSARPSNSLEDIERSLGIK